MIPIKNVPGNATVDEEKRVSARIAVFAWIVKIKIKRRV
jgi:hypothetical protein